MLETSQLQPIIWLTGATGYLGSHITRYLLASGYRLRIIKRTGSSLRRLPQDPAIEFFDTGDDWQTLMRESPPPQAVIHCATSYGRLGENEQHVFDTNVGFACEALESTILARCPRFINADTSLPATVSPYAAAKERFRELARRRITGSATDFINIRLEHFFGPDDAPSKFTSHVIRACIANLPSLDLTEGLQHRDFIFIDDVVRAFKLLLGQPHTPGLWRDIPVGSGKTVTVRDFVELVKRISGAKTKLNFGAIPYRTNEVMLCKADISAIRALNWEPRYELHEALSFTIEQERKL